MSINYILFHSFLIILYHCLRMNGNEKSKLSAWMLCHVVDGTVWGKKKLLCHVLALYKFFTECTVLRSSYTVVYLYFDSHPLTLVALSPSTL